MTRADIPAHLPRDPAVSIIIPAYNAATTLGETLDSVLAQTFQDIEAIVIDDGSADSTADVARATGDPRIVVLTTQHTGLSEARNTGIAAARGEFLAFLDADDLWTPDKLELQVEALRRQPDAGVAYSWVMFVDEAGRDLHPRKAVHHEGDVRRDLLLDCFVATASNPMLTRACVEATGLFDPGLARAEDWDYWLRASRAWPFVLVPRYQVRYRITPDARSSAIEDFVRDATTVLEREFATGPPKLCDLRPRAIARFERYTAFACLTRTPAHGWRRRAARQLARGVRRSPAILLERDTWNVVAAWVVALAPGGAGARAVRALLRLHGQLALRRASG